MVSCRTQLPRGIALAAGAALLALAATGCGPGRFIRRGDALMLEGHAAAAEASYRRALGVSPELAADPIFAGKLRRARSQKAYDAGMRAAHEGQWDVAIASFVDSRDADPTFAQAPQALAWAQREGAKAHHARALGWADQGRLADAVASARHAAALDPSHAGARDALDSAQQRSTPGLAQAHQLYIQAQALAGQRRWRQALLALRQALTANASHLPVRVAISQARQAIAQAEEHCATGGRLLAAKRLDRAREAFQQALAVWPYFDEARQLLDQGTARREEAEQLYRRAAALAGQAQWPEVVTAASQALELFPYHQAAITLRAEARTQSARAHCVRGRQHLARRELERGEAEFRRALAYVPGFPEAKAGLAAADGARAADAEGRGLWGNALLWWMEAYADLPSPAVKAPLDQAGAKARAAARFAAVVRVHDVRRAGRPAAAAFRDRLLARVEATKPPVLEVHPPPDVLRTVAGTLPLVPRPPAAAYEADVRLVALDVRTAITKTENRVHEYTVYQDVPNPAIPELRRRLAAARIEYDAAHREFRRPCLRCGGKGRVRCSECSGSGKRVCRTCRGTGRSPCAKCRGKGSVEGKRCSHCRGSRTVACTSCKHGGTRPCTQCGGKKVASCLSCRGTGRSGRVSESDLRRRERDVFAIEARLRRAPHVVTQAFPAAWRYLVHYYEKTGGAEVDLQLRDVAANTTVKTDTLTAKTRYDDTTVQNANPAIGLPEDPLELPDDGGVHRWLIDASADEAAARLVAALVEARAAALKSQAEALARQGRELAAVEAQVSYALTIEGANPKGAAQVLARLGQALRARLPRP